MAEPRLGPAAETLRRFDPDLFATALFAPEPGRGRLMTLYAFDVELSRAADPARRSETGPMLAAIRVQWWRDMLAAAFEGSAALPQGHEVAAPLFQLIREGRLPRAEAEALIEARECEIDAGPAAERFDAWGDARFGALTRAAAACLDAPAPEAAAPAGRALARAFGLRTAAAMAREGRGLLPGLDPAMRAALARGEAVDPLCDLIAEVARDGLDALRSARRTGAPRAALPAFLTLFQAEHALSVALARPETVAVGLAQASPARRALALGWRALTGRW